MKFLEVFRFEFTYQARRLSTWLFFPVLALFAAVQLRGNFLADALYDDFYVNSPFVIAVITVFGSLIWLLTAAMISGQAAARDVQTRMHSLTYSSSVNRFEYLGGKFLAAWVLNCLIMLGVPAGIMLGVYLPGIDADVIGPFRPEAYWRAWIYFAMPNVFIGTAIQFAAATLLRRVVAGYVGSLFLFFTTYIVGGLIGFMLGWIDMARMFDSIGVITGVMDTALEWTPIEKSTRLPEMDGILLRSRLIWIGVATLALTITYIRFRFTHPSVGSWLRWLPFWRVAKAPEAGDIPIERSAIDIPQVARRFNFATYFRQAAAIMWSSFWLIFRRRAAFIFMGFIGLVFTMVLPENMENMEVPMIPVTGKVLSFLTSAARNVVTPWVLIPLMIIIYTGELLWREREAGVNEIIDAAPVPEWTLLMGKFMGICVFLVLFLSMLFVVGILVQVQMGFHDYQVGLYIKVLFGLQLPEYLLFAMMVMMVQVTVNQKYMGHLVSMVVFILMAFSDKIGLRHHLLVYSASPEWSYTEIRGFGNSLTPWIWFKLYWFAWALLLAVVARLLWARGNVSGFRMRWQLARGRFTLATGWVAAVAIGLIVTLGGFIFYNTNVLNDYNTASSVMKRKAAYEKQYGKYRHVPQPQLKRVNLIVELYTKRGAMDIHGVYHLKNEGTVPIDSIHLGTVTGANTNSFIFSRKVKQVIADDELGYYIFALEKPLQPGDSLHFNFSVNYKRHGLGNSGAANVIVPNGSYINSLDWMPGIGYDAGRELLKPTERRAQGLPSRPLIPLPEEIETRVGFASRLRIDVETVIGVEDNNQTAVAPGALQQSWTHQGRRYFHYKTTGPIGNEYAFFSAEYAVKESKWNDVAIKVYYHPKHAYNVDRLMHSVQSCLANYSRQYGPYPYKDIKLIERAGAGVGAHSETSTIDYSEGFALFNPGEKAKELDLPFAIIAHEMGHQWWGGQLSYALAAGGGLLTESAAWYSAMGVMDETFGREHLNRLRAFFRNPYPIPPIRQSVPLLRGADPYAAYRKGPFALYAMSEYMGKNKVDTAFRRLIEKQQSGELGPATSLDLYRELKAVTPDTLQYLLHDLFEANTFWELETEEAKAVKTPSGHWQVTLNVLARKLTVDSAGIEKEVPVNDWIEIGVFAPAEKDKPLAKPLYLQKHFIHSGKQSVTVTTPVEPGRAGIDPYYLLIDLETRDNNKSIQK